MRFHTSLARPFAGPSIGLAIAFALSFGIIGTARAPLRAAPETAAEPGLEHWLPEDVIGFVKIRDLGKTVKELQAAGLRDRIQGLSIFQHLRQEQGAQKLFDGLREIREAAGRPALEIVDDLIGVEAIVGARLNFPPEVLVIARSRGPEALAAGIENLKAIVAKRHGAFPETGKLERDGVTIESVDGRLAFASIGKHFFISNSLSAVEDMIALSRGKKTASAATASAFAGAIAKDGEGAADLVTAVVRPSYIPGYRIPERADNPLGSLLLSGWLDALRSSELLCARLRVAAGGLRLSVETRGPADGVKNAAVFFPETAAADRADLAAIDRRDNVGVLHIARDIGKWWQLKDALLDPGAAGDLVNANGVLSVFFGGMSFQDEVLPALTGGVTIVARSQSYEHLGKAPRPEIPGFAAIFRLTEPDKLTQRVTSAFQSLVSIINFDRAQKGRGALFLLGLDKVGETNLYTADVMVPDDKKGEVPGIELNFSPTLAIVGSRVVLSSSKELGRRLVEDLQGAAGASERPGGGAGDRISLDAAAIRKIVGANESFFADTMMLNDGISQEEARARMRAIDEIIGLFKGLTLTSRADKGAVALQVELDLADRAAKAGAAESGGRRAGKTQDL